MKNPTTQEEYDQLVAEWQVADHYSMASDESTVAMAAEKRAEECQRIVSRCMVSKDGLFIAVEDDPDLDDKAVDAFAKALKAKLAKSRAKGRRGWQDCPAHILREGMRVHVERGDPLDVAVYTLFLWARWESTKGGGACS